MSSSNLENLARSFQNYVNSKSYNSVIFQVLNKEDLYTDEQIKPYISNGLKCFVKNEGVYYKYIDGVWYLDKAWEISENEPVDKTVLWIPTSRFMSSKDNVAINTLLQSMEALVAKVDALEARVAYLEEHGSSGSGGGSSSEDTDIENALLLNDGEPLLLNDDSLLLLYVGSTSTDPIINNALLLNDGDPLLLNDDSLLLLK